MAEISGELGTPFMPWQRDTADVAMEIDPATGLLAYRTVIITVPRQSGKTKQELAVAVHRALGFGGDQRINYTAQSRIKARQKWEDDHVRTLERSPFRSLFRVRKTLGMEAIIWANGSQHGIESTTEKSGHGDTLDLGFIDEAFAQRDSRIEQAFKPAMMTRPQPQLWVVSTAGTEASEYLRGKVDRGRLRCEMGLTGSVCYVEYSAPDDADPADPATWRACMPALGHTVTEAAVQADFESMDLPEFRRAYLNQWPDAAPPGWGVVAEEDWAGLVDPGSQIAGPVVFAAAFSHDRRSAAIGVCGRRADGVTHVELADYRGGTAWAVPRLIELAARHSAAAVVVDAGSHEGSMIPELEDAHVEVTSPSVREIAQAFGQFYEAATDSGSLRHLGQAELDAALRFAVTRDIGDGGRTWGRKASSAADISPLVAVTLARYGLMAYGSPAPEPNIF